MHAPPLTFELAFNVKIRKDLQQVSESNDSGQTPNTSTLQPNAVKLKSTCRSLSVKSSTHRRLHCIEYVGHTRATFLDKASLLQLFLFVIYSLCDSFTNPIHQASKLPSSSDLIPCTHHHGRGQIRLHRLFIAGTRRRELVFCPGPPTPRPPIYGPSRL